MDQAPHESRHYVNGNLCVWPTAARVYADIASIVKSNTARANRLQMSKDRARILVPPD
jgi:hypothetical protein